MRALCLLVAVGFVAAGMYRNKETTTTIDTTNTHDGETPWYFGVSEIVKPGAGPLQKDGDELHTEWMVMRPNEAAVAEEIAAYAYSLALDMPDSTSAVVTILRYGDAPLGSVVFNLDELRKWGADAALTALTDTL